MSSIHTTFIIVCLDIYVKHSFTLQSYSFKSKEDTPSKRDKSPHSRHSLRRSQTVVEKSYKRDGKTVSSKTVTTHITSRNNGKIIKINKSILSE